MTMNWTNLFSKNDEISPDEAKLRLAEAGATESLQLLDVRQPGEYQEQHLPGAILIPLRELPDRLAELDPAKETIVYCRSGARSRSATQFLQEKNFSKVYNMTGGILSWHGHVAQGGEEAGIEFFIQASYEDGISMAYAMENGLRQFYQETARLTNAQGKHAIADLLLTMAKFEDGHMAKLAAKYDLEATKSKLETSVLEGGFSTETMVTTFAPHLTGPDTVIQIAMMFEAQAYDLYSRLARRTESEKLRSFYLEMAAEERKHLDKLSEHLDNLLT